MSERSFCRPKTAMILAAGHGNRLRPLTANLAKPAVPVLGRALVSYTLNNLARRGFENIVVNLSHEADALASLLRAESERLRLNLRLSFEAEPLGTAGGLAKASPLIREFPSETFLLLNGDTLSRFELDEIVQAFDPSVADAAILARDLPAGTEHTSVLISDGRVRALRKPEGAHMFAGVWLIHERALDRLSGRATGLEVELMSPLIAESRLCASVQDSDWITIDTPRRYLDACRVMVRKKLFSEWWNVKPPGRAVSGNARLVVGERTKIEPEVSFRGEVVIGDDCHIGRGSEIHNSVLWNRVKLGAGALVRNSIMADEASLDEEAELTDEIVMRAHGDTERFRAAELTMGVVRAPIRR